MKEPAWGTCWSLRIRFLNKCTTDVFFIVQRAADLNQVYLRDICLCAKMKFVPPSRWNLVRGHSYIWGSWQYVIRMGKMFQLWQRLNLPSLIGSASCLMFPRLGGWNVEMRGSIKETFSWPNISRWCDSAQQQKSVCGGWWWSKMVLTSTNSLEASDFLGQLPSGTFLLPGANLRNTPIHVFIERTTCSTPGHLLWRG